MKLNQAGSQLPGLAQLNGNGQMPSLGGVSRSALNMDPEFPRAREFIQEKICETLFRRHQQPISEIQKRRIKDLAKRLEEGMLKNAPSKEEYMNLETLEARLSLFLRQATMNNRSQQYPQLVSSSPIGTMIPTPGMSHGPNSNVVVASSIDASMISSSGGNSVVSTTFNGVNILPTGGIHGSSLNRSDGLSNGYQQSSTSFSAGSVGNMSSMSVPRTSSQMIPTPGYTVNSNHSHMNVDSSTNGNVFSSAESTMVPLSQLQQQKQHVGDQSQVLPNIGSQMSSGMRSGLLHKQFTNSNGAVNSGLGLIGNNIQLPNEPVTSDGYASTYANSPKHIHQHFDQNQKPVMQGDGYGLNNVDPFASGNFYASATSSGSMMNTRNTNSVQLPSIPKTSSLISGHSNLHGMQQSAHIKSEAINQLEKLNFQSSSTSRDALLHSQQQYQQRPHQFQQSEQYPQSQQQFQLKLHSQQPRHLVNDNAFNQSQLSSNLENQVKSEPGIEHHKEVLSSHVPEQFHMSEIQNQFQQNSSEDCSRAQYLSFPSGQHNLSSSVPQSSQQMLHPHHLVAESQNKFSCLTVEAQCNSKQWTDSQDGNPMSNNSSHDHHLHVDFHQRISGKDEAHCNNLSSDVSMGQAVAPRGAAEPLDPGSTTKNAHRNQQRWLLFLLHARRCSAPEGRCQERFCSFAQKLCRHMDGCNLRHCPYPRCHHTKELFHHFIHCKDPCCPVCVFVKKCRRACQLKAQSQPPSESSLPSVVNGSCKSYNITATSSRLISKPTLVVETSEDLHPSVKRIKIEHSTQSVNLEKDNSASSVSANCDSVVSRDAQSQTYPNAEKSISIKSEITEVKAEVLAHAKLSEMKMDSSNADDKIPDGEPVKNDDTGNLARPENMKTEKEVGQDKQEHVMQPGENAAGTKSGKPKIKGVSLTELFTPEQVREHITGLRQWVGQSKSKAEKNQAMEHSMSENSCQLCAVEKLTFEPPPIYCTTCGVRIKRNNMYYTMGTGDTRHYFCIPCYNDARSEHIVVDGTPIAKSRLEKKKNDEETEEWVRTTCDILLLD